MQAFPYSEAEVIDFLRQRAPELIMSLDPTRRPFWGQMTAPQMLFHLTEWVGRSAGRNSLSVPLPAAHFEPIRQWLLSAAPLANYPPLPAPLASLAADATLAPAVVALRQELEDFFDYHARHPVATFAHPVFGPLTYGQWLVMHFKHFNHHLMQFGLLPNSLLPNSLLPYRCAQLLLSGSSTNFNSISA